MTMSIWVVVDGEARRLQGAHQQLLADREEHGVRVVRQQPLGGGDDGVLEMSSTGVGRPSDSFFMRHVRILVGLFER